MRAWVFSLFVAAFAAPVAFSAEPDPALERIKKDIDFLAGEECQGRGLKTDGLKKAGDYLATAFKDSGLKPAFKDGSYFQKFTVSGPGKLGTPIALTFHQGETSKELKIKDDFTALSSSGAGKKSTGLVFVGYGITSKAPAYDDYAGMDVKGKTVVILRRTPKADDAKGPFDQTSEDSPAPLASKIQNAIAHGAVGILFVSDRGTAAKADPLMEAARGDGSYCDGPVYHVKRAVIDELVKAQKEKTLAEIEEAIDKNLKPFSFELKGWKAATEVTVVRDVLPTRNVIGVCEGAGPLAEETIVIGAHYDHLGSGEPGSQKNNAGKTHYGADDNGSGTTGLLEMARRYGKMKDRKGRRIVFIAFSGEEAGLLGSVHYCKEPAFPLEKTKFMINLDMIGRLDFAKAKDGEEKPKQEFLEVYGTGTTPGLDKLVDETNKNFHFKFSKIPGGAGPSDHASFYAKGVPVLFLFTGTHKDYHQPTDTPEKINLAGLKKVVDFAQVFSEHYSTTTDPIAYVKIRSASPSGVRSGPRLGIAPGDYSEVDAGVLVGAVSEGGAAEKAGIKENDVILSIAGLPVKNIQTYMAAMSAQKFGVEIEIVVLRKDKKLTLKATPLK